MWVSRGAENVDLDGPRFLETAMSPSGRGLSQSRWTTSPEINVFSGAGERMRTSVARMRPDAFLH